MVHGELKMKLWTSMLDLEAFTVAELAEHAGVEPKQTYSELASLQKYGVLKAESIQSNAKHRPLNLYRLTADEKVRQGFISAHLTPRLRASTRLPLDGLRDSDARRKAHILLDEIDVEICQLESRPSPNFWHLPKHADVQIRQIKTKLGSARAYLETAIYEAGLKDDRSAAPMHPVTIDSKRFRHFSGRIEILEGESQRVQLTLEAQQNFTEKILRAALDEKQRPRDSSFILGLTRNTWGRTANRVFRQMLSAFVTELEVLDSREDRAQYEDYSQLLASKAIRWSSSPKLLYTCLDRLTMDSETNEYNRLNACFLEGRRRDAFVAWCKWTDEHLSGSSLNLSRAKYFQYPGVAIAVFEDAHQASECSRMFENMSGPSASVSAASFAEVDFLTLDQTSAVPTLFDPEGAVNEIRLAESMTKDIRPLFASGQLSQRLGLPGVPEVRLATVLLSIGVKRGDAWTAAEKLTKKSVLLVVCAADSASLLPAYEASRQPDSILRNARFYGGDFEKMTGSLLRLASSTTEAAAMAE